VRLYLGAIGTALGGRCGSSRWVSGLAEIERACVRMLGGVTTFMTMSYIIVVIRFFAEAGIGSMASLAKCISGCRVDAGYGAVGEHPIALAPGIRSTHLHLLGVLGKALRGIRAGGRIYFGLARSAPHAHGVREPIVNRHPYCLQYSHAAVHLIVHSFRVGLRNAKLVVVAACDFVGWGIFHIMKCQIAVFD